MINDILEAYVFLTASSDKVLSELRSEDFKSEKLYKLNKAWGAVIGQAIIADNKNLLNELQPILDDHYGASVRYGAFSYLVEKKNYDLAEKLIGAMIHREKADCYRRLAREEMGIEYWDYFNDKVLDRSL